MRLCETEFVKRLTPAGLLELKTLAASHGLTLSDICRLGYEAETGPYRYHLMTTKEELAWLDEQAIKNGTSRSAFFLNSCRNLIHNNRTAVICSLKANDIIPFGAVSTTISFNNIDFVMMLDDMMEEVQISQRRFIRGLFLAVKHSMEM